MEISKYKQAMKYLLNDNAPLKTFVINPDARLVDNDPRPQTESLSLANGGRVGFDLGGLSKLPDGRYQYRGSRSKKQTRKIFKTKHFIRQGAHEGCVQK